ncbi:MAG TPA: glycosyltransferase family 4 protein [Acidimicrobiales bacterium]|nr:glycosyltransferase family 4 protein [Acidimicrobiales bacterium]
MAAPSRVLLVVAHGGSGGMQVQVSLLARGLVAAGCDVAVAAGPGDLDVGDVEVHRLPALSATTAARFAAALRRAVASGDPDVVHGHGLRLAPFLSAAARPRSIVTCHGVDPARARRTAALVRLSGVRVASCGEGPRGVLAAVGVPSRVLDNAVPSMPASLDRADVAARFGLDPAALLVVSPARLSPQKDPVTLVRALAHARGASGILVGGGPLAGEVRAEVAREGLAGRVVVADWLEDARAILASADVLALASVWEGQPTVVLEAMCAGVAVVATSCTGTRDTVVDNVTGLLAAPRDPAALGAAIERAGSADLRARLVEAARVTAAAHTLPVVVAAHLDAYERLASGRWIETLERP